MSRVLLQYLLPLILPTVLYLLWWWTIGRRRARAAGHPAGLADGPWFWLIVSGCVLAGGALVYTGLTGGMEAGGDYMPPRLEDGRVVPGHMQPRGAPP
jgi:hypothetical protein